MKSYYVHIIRHGDIGNEKGKYIGVTDVPLSLDGLKRLKQLKEKFKYPKATVFYVSPLIRCVRTLVEIYPNAKPNVLNGLCEYNFGKWENKTPDELIKESSFVRWLRGEENIFPPEGESNIAFRNRICTTFETIVNNLIRCGNTQSAIVAHGGIISMLLSIYGYPKENFLKLNINPGHGFSLRITPSIWMKAKIFEVYDKIPLSNTKEI